MKRIILSLSLLILAGCACPVEAMNVKEKIATALKAGAGFSNMFLGGFAAWDMMKKTYEHAMNHTNALKYINGQKNSFAMPEMLKAVSLREQSLKTLLAIRKTHIPLFFASSIASTYLLKDAAGSLKNKTK